MKSGMLLVVCAAGLMAAGGIEKIDLFHAGEGGYAHYRIPGVVVTAKGTVLAYAEARKTLRGDWGTIDIVLRRSTDGGRTWSVPRGIASVDGPKRKNPVAMAQGLAGEGEVTYNNPVAIADRNGVVHFVFCLEYMRAFYMRSEDDGLSFSKPVEITGAFEGFRPEYDWKVLATGPGHGIQLRNGRLVVAVWLSLGTGGHAHRPSQAATIYSDDHGKTWKHGAFAVTDTAEMIFPNETAVAQLADGRVVLNTRTESKRNRRVLTYGRDGAGGWSKPVFQEELLEPICMGSMVAARLGGKDVLLFANPDNLERGDGSAEPGKPRDRKNVTVQLSEDGGKTWRVKRTVEAGFSGYSDLAVLEDGTILLFYERGEKGDAAFRSAHLTVARFGVEWVRGK